uniref:Ig-like domain-containing protein n=1 Tax=Sphenodon punctatus TaxID=8508 RepID=A0A8D0HQE8_SPHPU
MDFRSPFPLQCVLVMMLAIIDGRVCVPTGGNLCLKIQNLSDLTNRTKNGFACSSYHLNDCVDCNRTMCFLDGEFKLENESKEDKEYNTFTSENITYNVFLKVYEPQRHPVVHAQCLPDGKGELSCEVDGSSSANFSWTLDGNHPATTEACIMNKGQKIILEKGVRGTLVCHEGKSTTSSSPIQLECDNGDFLKHPLFLYIVAACGGVAILLVIIASLLTCCYMKRKRNFIPVPSEEEKEEGLMLSVISSEELKSPPNGEHCEAPALPADRKPNSGTETSHSLETDATMALEPKMQAEPTSESEVKEMKLPEVIVDNVDPDNMDDCFPDPIDP